MAEKKTEAKTPWEVMLPISLPKGGKNDGKSVYVAVNGKGYQVPKGKVVNVPKPVHDRLMIMQAAEAETTDYERDVEGEFQLG